MIDADIHPFRRPQIANLIAEKASTKVFIEYADFANVFSLDLASKPPEYTGINNYAIELVYANGFIRPSKSSTSASIFFDRKLDKSLWLCVWSLNNLTIKS